MMWHIHAMEYYSAIKKNEKCHLQQYGGTETLSCWAKVSQTKTNIYGIAYIQSFFKKKYKQTYLQNRNRVMDVENKFMVTRG